MEADALGVPRDLLPEPAHLAVELDRLEGLLERLRSRARRETEFDHLAVAVGDRCAGRVHALLHAQGLETLKPERTVPPPVNSILKLYPVQ